MKFTMLVNPPCAGGNCHALKIKPVNFLAKSNTIASPKIGHFSATVPHHCYSIWRGRIQNWTLQYFERGEMQDKAVRHQKFIKDEAKEHFQDILGRK